MEFLEKDEPLPQPSLEVIKISARSSLRSNTHHYSRDRLERTIAEAIKETSNQIIQEIKAEIRAVEESSDSLDRRDSPSLDDFDPLCADNLSGPPSPERQRNFAQGRKCS